LAAPAIRPRQGTTKKKGWFVSVLLTVRTSPSTLPDVDTERTPVNTSSCPAAQFKDAELHSTISWDPFVPPNPVALVARSGVATAPVWLASMPGASARQYLPVAGFGTAARFFERVNVLSAATRP